MNTIFLQIGVIALFLWILATLVLSLAGKHKAMEILMLVFCFIVIGGIMALVVIKLFAGTPV